MTKVLLFQPWSVSYLQPRYICDGWVCMCVCVHACLHREGCWTVIITLSELKTM